jgi:exodeoxyribonuclease X
LHHDFGDVQYGLNYLRYKLDLPIPDDLTSHRANADTLICAELLKHLVTRAIDLKLIDSTQDIGTQLHNLCWGHIPVLLWPFGKHKGQTLDSLTNDYYLWALSNVSALQEKDPGYDNDLAESVRLVLEQRLAAAA